MMGCSNASMKDVCSKSESFKFEQTLLPSRKDLIGLIGQTSKLKNASVEMGDYGNVPPKMGRRGPYSRLSALLVVCLHNGRAKRWN